MVELMINEKHIMLKCFMSLNYLIYLNIIFEYLYVLLPAFQIISYSKESWRVKVFSSVTKIIERNIKIYNIK